MKNKMKLFLILITVNMMLKIVCYAGEVSADASSVAVKTSTIIEKSIGKTLTVYGFLSPDPDQVLSLSLPHAGLINRVWVRLGQRVKNADKLLEVVTAPDARMQYLQAQSAVDFANRELKRTQRLLKEQLATKANVDSAHKTLNDANASLEAMRKRGLDRSEETLLAPMDGIVIKLNIAQGQRVLANTSAMLIAAEKRLIARMGVEAEDLILLKPGVAVTITSVFVPDIKVESTIREVHAMINPTTHLVEILVPIPENQVSDLVLGSRIIGHIHLTPHPALMVPDSAVLGNATNAFVYVIRQGKAYKVKIQTGLEQNNEIEISGAIKAGERIITLGNYELSDGMSIREIK